MLLLSQLSVEILRKFQRLHLTSNPAIRRDLWAHNMTTPTPRIQQSDGTYGHKYDFTYTSKTAIKWDLWAHRMTTPTPRIQQSNGTFGHKV